MTLTLFKTVWVYEEEAITDVTVAVERFLQFVIN